MAFGPLMQCIVNGFTVLMRPPRTDEASYYLPGIQSLAVTRTLGMRTAPVLQDEQEHLESLRSDHSKIAWAITVMTGEHPDGLFIGESTLHINEHNKTGNTGSVIFNRDWWGLGIAKHCHKMRTAFAFNQLGLTVLESGYLKGNEASRRALWRSGYEHTGGFELHKKCDNGTWKPMIHMLCVNPRERTWEEVWEDMEEIPHAFLAARERTNTALKWTDSNVEWP